MSSIFLPVLRHKDFFGWVTSLHGEKNVENNGRVAFIGIVIHNHFVLPMSLFIDFDVSLPKPHLFFNEVYLFFIYFKLPKPLFIDAESHRAY